MEFAILLPVCVVLLFGAIDVGRGLMARKTLANAARAGCRLSTVQADLPATAVPELVASIMDEAGMAGYQLTVDPPAEASVPRLTPVTVTVSIPFDRVSWLPTSWFLQGRSLSATCIMPADVHEQPDASP